MPGGKQGKRNKDLGPGRKTEREEGTIALKLISPTHESGLIDVAEKWKQREGRDEKDTNWRDVGPRSYQK